MASVGSKFKCCRFFGLKNLGLAALAFSVGIIAGMILPIYCVAVCETVVIIILGYLCLFVW